MKTQIDVSCFERDAVLYHELGQRLLSHLAPMKIAPRHILHLDCASGALSRQLAQQFKRAYFEGFDQNVAMIQQANKHKPWLSRQRYTTYNALDSLQSKKPYDLILIHLLAFEDHSPAKWFQVVKTMMAPDGVILFSYVGPGSALSPRSELWDMHDVGDALVQAGFVSPVMESEKLTVSLDPEWPLQAQLQVNRLTALLSLEPSALNVANNVLHLEIIYGHAFLGQLRQHKAGISAEVAVIRPDQIGRRDA